MCNHHTSFSIFKKLSVANVIQLESDNSVTATHCKFVNIIQGYQLEVLHTPTFRLSLLSISQLDPGGPRSIFQIGKCFITLATSCSLPAKLMNAIYIIVPVTTPLS